MSDLTDRDQAADAAIDDALRTEPLAPVPAGLFAVVMGRVSPPPFRLAWVDYAMSAFLAGMVGVVVLLATMGQRLGVGDTSGQPLAIIPEDLAVFGLMLGGALLLIVGLVVLTTALIGRAPPRLTR